MNPLETLSDAELRGLWGVKINHWSDEIAQKIGNILDDFNVRTGSELFEKFIAGIETVEQIISPARSEMRSKHLGSPIHVLKKNKIGITAARSLGKRDKMLDRGWKYRWDMKLGPVVMLGVSDGNGDIGDLISQKIREELPKKIEKQIRKMKQYDSVQIKLILNQAFDETQKLIEDYIQAEQTRKGVIFNSGATVSVTILW